MAKGFPNLMPGRTPRAVNIISSAQSRLLGGFNPAQDLVRKVRGGKINMITRK